MMPLVKCPICAKDILSSTVSCPACGETIKSEIVILQYKDRDDFLDKNKDFPLHTCKKCNKMNELEIKRADIIISGKKMEFEELVILECQTCGNIQLVLHSIKMILSVFSELEQRGCKGVKLKSKGFREKYDYCTDVNFKYDFRDYEGIPGLSYDMEHSKKGFLTPVYFDKKSLIYFMHDEDYKVDLFSETYGLLQKNGIASIPFGINSNDKAVFWLGDLEYLDLKDRQLLLPHNVESDHKLVCSEFYAAQIGCEWSEPNIERRVFMKKKEVIDAIKNRYHVDISHLNDEVEEKIDTFQKPITFTERSIEWAINTIHKIVIEGISSEEFCKIYEATHEKLDNGYKGWKSIKHFQELLMSLFPLKTDCEIRDLISPMYLLNDMRIYYDHLISQSKKDTTKANIVKTLGMSDFDDFKFIYMTINSKMLKLYQVLLLGLTYDS